MIYHNDGFIILTLHRFIQDFRNRKICLKIHSLFFEGKMKSFLFFFFFQVDNSPLIKSIHKITLNTLSTILNSTQHKLYIIILLERQFNNNTKLLAYFPLRINIFNPAINKLIKQRIFHIGMNQPHRTLLPIHTLSISWHFLRASPHFPILLYASAASV